MFFFVTVGVLSVFKCYACYSQCYRLFGCIECCSVFECRCSNVSVFRVMSVYNIIECSVV